MDDVRYWVGVVVISLVPAVTLFWLSIHPFISLWRRLGATATLVIHSVGMMAVVAAVIAYRDMLMRGDLGTSYMLTALAVFLLIVAGVLRNGQKKVMSNTTLLGVSELAPSGHESNLVVEGVYARIRHPRYVQLGVAFLAYAMFANYLACYVAFGLGVVGVRIVVAFEERELVERFGDDYRRYMQTTPRFVPSVGI